MPTNAELIKLIEVMAASVQNCRAEHVSFDFRVYAPEDGGPAWTCNVSSCYVQLRRGRKVVRRAFFGSGDTPAEAHADALRNAACSRDEMEPGF